MGRTRAGLGDLQSTLSTLTANAENQAREQAVAYAWSLYDQYQVQIWLAGIAVATWMVWVSMGTNEALKRAREATP